MKWTLTELLQGTGRVEFDEDVVIDRAEFTKNSRINSVEGVQISGDGFLDDSEEHFYVNMHIEGVMLCPDAITGEEIEVPFETDTDETFVFEETEEDGVRLVTDEVIDLTEAVVDAILLEVPLQVTLAEEGSYPEGDGWKVYSEAEYQQSQNEKIDPRLAVLKQFKED